MLIPARTNSSVHGCEKRTHLSYRTIVSEPEMQFLVGRAVGLNGAVEYEREAAGTMSDSWPGKCAPLRDVDLSWAGEV